MEASNPIQPLSNDEPSEPTSESSDVVDLSAIAEKYPVNTKRMVLDLASFDAAKLTLIEMLDMGEVAGVEPQELASLLGRSSFDPRKARMLYGLGWVIARRAQPDLTYEEVITWKMEVVGKANPKAVERSKQRTKAIVNAAELSGLHPDDAAELTIAELGAYRDNRETRRRAVRRKR
jgi:hypothetical protein